MTDLEFITIILIILIPIVMLTLLYAFYTSLKLDYEDSMKKRFYMIICHIYNNSKDYSIEDLYEQINLNYEKFCQSFPDNKYTSILDLLETLIYNIDFFDNDKDFKKFFKNERSAEIRGFIIEMCSYIKNINPFISIPKKEADLLQSIQTALLNDNESLGINSLIHLSQEIKNKEKIIIKQDQVNKRATILSIVGVVLTIFFGIISFIKLI